MSLELWGGVECTVNRVGSRYFDQMAKSGHTTRLHDLDRFAELGLRTLRYPILWEKVQPDSPEKYHWDWSDARMERLQKLGLSPIVGLLHHGSGPRWTHLLDPGFPQRLADFAGAVARRYPWVDAYTPINEPLTTARFSGLYGHWYPHCRDDASFHQILLNQIEGTILAMEAIRSVRSDARLIQTEDLGKVFSSPLLDYQAEFENERRWLSFDLLSGKFEEKHPLWRYVTDTPKIDLGQVERISSRPCPPDIYGINYYVTSERFLDENLSAHPTESHGKNGFHSYADVAAVRTRPEGLIGPETLLAETSQRYAKPVAITEAHLGCTREEQLRWLMDAWNAGRRLRQKGIAVQAVTSWALLGAYDWNSLVTQESHTYEPGAFDLRSDPPRLTAIGRALSSIATTGDFTHPVLKVPGWWERADRMGGYHPAVYPKKAAPILILGGEGNLGRALGRICAQRGLPSQMLSHNEADIVRLESIQGALRRYRPWAVINAAAYTQIDTAERDEKACLAVNANGAALAAKACCMAGLPFVTFSSDLVFDGEKNGPYLEGDETCPLSFYGKSREMGEQRVAQAHAQALILRTSEQFSPWSLCRCLDSIFQGGGKLVVPQSSLSPTYVPDLCHALLDLLVDEESGLWHLTNEGEITWAEWARHLCRELSVPDFEIEIEARDDILPQRPRHSILRSSRGRLMPSLEDALCRFRNQAVPLYALWADRRTGPAIPSAVCSPGV